LRTSSVLADLPATVNVHWVPPSKSIPRLSPLKMSAASEITIKEPDKMSQRHDRLMNW
jgi:hypothetical protein